MCPQQCLMIFIVFTSVHLTSIGKSCSLTFNERYSVIQPFYLHNLWTWSISLLQWHEFGIWCLSCLFSRMMNGCLDTNNSTYPLFNLFWSTKKSRSRNEVLTSLSQKIDAYASNFLKNGCQTSLLNAFLQIRLLEIQHIFYDVSYKCHGYPDSLAIRAAPSPHHCNRGDVRCRSGPGSRGVAHPHHRDGSARQLAESPQGCCCRLRDDQAESGAVVRHREGAGLEHVPYFLYSLLVESSCGYHSCWNWSICMLTLFPLEWCFESMIFSLCFYLQQNGPQIHSVFEQCNQVRRICI